MTVCAAELVFHIAYAASLKDKRQVARRLIDRTKQRFSSVAVAEVATQDLLQTLTLGIATVSGEAGHAQQMLDTVIRFMEDSTDAELTSIRENV